MTASILVVDDDSDIRELLTELLRDDGFSVESAPNGQEALQRLGSSSDRIGLILLDLMMPVMNGWELAKLVKNHPQYSSIPVVLISAGPDVEAQSEALGTAGCLRKPLELQALLEVARRYC